ncbi:UbiH/UbiF/VisC/COQ6 family ubiquinone biosynthesis hydroxylase [Pseudoroseicyclus aestuarii]|nr:UbiH/UbiF/VisC/COQ6 family ubiquinone biosynthesis hydroxylase [Pseudoroseicyclus aestuarii]
MSTGSDILIVGGGLTGPVLALAARQAGLRPVLIDAQPPAVQEAPGFDGRAYALAAASVRMLRRLGIWQALEGGAQPMVEIKVSDGRAGEGAAPLYLLFDSSEVEDLAGPSGWMVEDRHLRPALSAALEAAGIPRHAPQTVTAQEVRAGRASVTLASGTSLDGALIVGCDGRRSGTATRAGITRGGWDYEQTAIVCAVRHERPHEGVAHQFFMPGGPLAILPLQGNRSSIVWSEHRPRAEALLAMDDATFLDALRPAFGSFLGEISLEGDRFGYPLGLSLADSFAAPRVALVGDAAHGLHPIAGQGLNAGLRDVAALAAVLEEARRRGEDIGALPVLERYARWRRSDTAMLAGTTDLTNRLFSNDNALLRGLRDLGLGAVSSLPPLRRALIREAAGISGDLPPLMR